MKDPTGHAVEYDPDDAREDDSALLDGLEELEEDDFSELEDLLAEATRATAEDRALKAARSRLARISTSNRPEAQFERDSLIADIRRLEEGRVWLTVGTVALFHTQTCAVCGAKHALFMGWFGEQKHTSDPNARRLLAGRPIERLPERREDHFQGTVEMCGECCESQLAINIATGEAPAAS